MAAVKFKASKFLEVYEGFEDNGLRVHAKDGEIIEVSDKKSAQLLEDFKDNFEKAGVSEVKKAELEANKKAHVVKAESKKANDEASALEAAEKAVADAEAKMKDAKTKAVAAEGKRRGVMAAQYGRAKKAYAKAVDARDKLKAEIMAA